MSHQEIYLGILWCAWFIMYHSHWLACLLINDHQTHTQRPHLHAGMCSLLWTCLKLSTSIGVHLHSTTIAKCTSQCHSDGPAMMSDCQHSADFLLRWCWSSSSDSLGTLNSWLFHPSPSLARLPVDVWHMITLRICAPLSSVRWGYRRYRSFIGRSIDWLIETECMPCGNINL